MSKGLREDVVLGSGCLIIIVNLIVLKIALVCDADLAIQIENIPTISTEFIKTENEEICNSLEIGMSSFTILSMGKFEYLYCILIW